MPDPDGLETERQLEQAASFARDIEREAYGLRVRQAARDKVSPGMLDFEVSGQMLARWADEAKVPVTGRSW